MFDVAQRTRGGPHVCGEAHHSTSEGSTGTSGVTVAEVAGVGSDLQERASAPRGAGARLARGAAGIRRRPRRDLRIGDAVRHRLSRGRRAASVCELHAAGGSAAGFVQWFMDTSCADCARSMTAAHPGHFLIQVPLGGKQEVIEPTGGSPQPPASSSTTTTRPPLPHPPAPGTDAQAADVAPSGTSMPISGVRHEFRDVPRDSRARLCVEFPKTSGVGAARAATPRAVRVPVARPHSPDFGLRTAWMRRRRASRSCCARCRTATILTALADFWAAASSWLLVWRSPVAMSFRIVRTMALIQRALGSNWRSATSEPTVWWSGPAREQPVGVQNGRCRIWRSSV